MDTDGEMQQMNDCAEGAEDHAVIRCIETTADLREKCPAALLLILPPYPAVFRAVFDGSQLIKYGFMQKQ